MSDFGDFDPDDALDTEPPDAEQVARRLHHYRLERARETRGFDELDLAEQTILVAIAAALIAWLRRQGAIR